REGAVHRLPWGACAGGLAALREARRLQRAVEPNRCARGLRPGAGEEPARRRDLGARGAADGGLGDRRPDHGRPGSCGGGRRGGGALGGRLRRAAVAVMGGAAQWEAMALRWERGRELLWRSTRPVSEWLVERLEPRPGQVVLDLAAGTGETGFLAAPAL